MRRVATEAPWPDALLDIGPPTDEGFYYDFDVQSHRFSPEDFGKIEEEMKKVVKENQTFEKSIKTREEAQVFFDGRGQKYKIERLADIPAGEPISFYQKAMAVQARFRRAWARADVDLAAARL